MQQALFSGQQEDERVLYEVVPHASGRVFRAIQVLVVAVACGYAWYFICWRFGFVDQKALFGGFWGIGVSAFLVMLFLDHGVKSARTYITDRRIVRFEPYLGVFRKRRALFWKEVAKTKAFAPNLLFRIFGVGTIEIRPNFANDEDIRIPCVYYYEDLVNYIDKILYVHKNKPDEINHLRPFVTKPKGERYS